MGAAESVPDLRIVLVGQTGHGKSATGNTILGFQAFDSESGPRCTNKCQMVTTVLADGRTLAVIDTPGFFDGKSSKREMMAEVKKCARLSSPGPHVILYVVHLRRFTEGEMEAARLFQSAFRRRARAYLILLFTWKEDLDGRTLQEGLSEAGESLGPLWEQIDACDHRCLAFNNKAQGEERRDQVDELIRMVDALLRENQSNPYYTEEMMEQDKASAPGWPCSLL